MNKMNAVLFAGGDDMDIRCLLVAQPFHRRTLLGAHQG